MNNIDLLNVEGLDESLLNVSAKYSPYKSSNFTNESLLDGMTTNTSLLNASGVEPDEIPQIQTPSKGAKVTPEMVQAGLMAGAAVASGVQQRKASEAGMEKKAIRLACGMKPLFGKKKKEAYRACAANVIKERQGSQLPPYTPPVDETKRIYQDSGDGKVMGMPKGVFIALGVVVLAVGGYFAVKAIKKARG